MAEPRESLQRCRVVNGLSESSVSVQVKVYVFRHSDHTDSSSHFSVKSWKGSQRSLKRSLLQILQNTMKYIWHRLVRALQSGT